MRPKLLVIEGLQSYKEAVEIDFDVLSQTGIFGIFGPTGSGKSTVLDAITLALYGKVTRADRGTQGIINSLSQRVRVSFSFELKKPGKTCLYKVERVYARKKGTDNSCEAKVARLIEIDNDVETPLCDKSGEVTAKVEELIGLSHEDFIRAVVLPQNKFQEFLLLDKKQKREMLERVFYLEEYGKGLNEKILTRVKKIDVKVSETRAKLSVLGDASDDAREEAKKNLNIAKDKKENVDKDFVIREASFKQLNEIWELVLERKTVITKQEVILIKNEEMENSKIKIARCEKALEINEYINRYKEEEKRLSNTLQELKEVDLSLPQIRQENEQLKRVFEDFKNDKDKNSPALIEKKAILNTGMDMQKENKVLEEERVLRQSEYKKLSISKKQLDEKVKEINLANVELSISIEKSKKEVEDIKVDQDYKNKILELVKVESQVMSSQKVVEEETLQHTQLQTTLQEKSQKLKVVEEELGKLQEELGKNNICNIPDRENIKENQLVIVQLEAYLNQLLDIDTQIKKGETKLKTETENIKNYINERIDLEEKYKEKSQKLNELIKIEDELQKSLNENMVFSLSKTLEKGKECPVCGSLEHPNPHMGEGKLNLLDMEKELGDINSKRVVEETNLKLLKDMDFQVVAKFEGSEQVNKTATEELEERKNAKKEILDRFPQEMKELSIEEIKFKLIQRKEENLEKIKKIDILEGIVSLINTEIINKTNLQIAFRAEIEIILESSEKQKKKLVELNSGYEILKGNYNNDISGLNIKTPQLEYENIINLEKKSEKLRVSIEESQQISNKNTLQLNNLQVELNQYINDLASVETQGRALKNRIDENLKKIQAYISDNRTLEEEIELVEKNLKEYLTKELDLQEGLAKSENIFNSLLQKKFTLDNQRDIFQNNVNKEMEKLKEKVIEKGFRDVQEVLEAVFDEEEIKKIIVAVNNFDQEVTNIKAQLQMIDSKLTGRNCLEEDFNLAKNEFEEIKNSKEISNSNYEVSKNIFETTSEKNLDWKKYSKEYSDLLKKSELAEQLKGLIRGNSFIDFVAEERLRYVAKEAQEVLSSLTCHRYFLEIDSESSFVIRDNFNGGVYRPVSTLSGGETFLTALSLALALSKNIQLKGKSPLEFFFLDEGFGTLDNNLLDTVMDSLEKLGSSERIIGLISHVPELRYRIPRRLIISPPSIDSQGSKVRIEKG